MSLKRSLAMPYAREVRGRLDHCALQTTWRQGNICSQGNVSGYRPASFSSNAGAQSRAVSQPESTLLYSRDSRQGHGGALQNSSSHEQCSATRHDGGLSQPQDHFELQCPICNDVIGGLSESERQQHSNKCLDESCREASSFPGEQSYSSSSSFGATVNSSNGIVSMDCSAKKPKKRPIVREAKTAPRADFILDLSEHDDDFVPNIVTKVSKAPTRQKVSKPKITKQGVKTAAIFNKNNVIPLQPKNEKASLRQEISSLDSQIAELQAKRGRLITKLKKIDLAQSSVDKKKVLVGRDLRPVRIVIELVFGTYGGEKSVPAINDCRIRPQSCVCPLWDASKQMLEQESVRSPLGAATSALSENSSTVTVDEAERARIAEFLLADENNSISAVEKEGDN